MDAAPIDAAVAEARCPDYRSFSPRALVTLLPTVGSVDITVPPEHVVPVSRSADEERGGRGAMFNYRAFALDSRSPGGHGSSHRYLDTTLGFNLDDWIFRSQQSYIQSAGNGIGRWQSAFAQKTFIEQRQVLQAGWITTYSPLFGGIPIQGAQWLPERALALQANVAVTGIAATRARVELSQNGVMLLSTVVPPGPFSINDYPLQNRSIDLNVRLVEDTGTEQKFVVPASSLMLAGSNSTTEGFSLAAGTLWDQSDAGMYRSSPVFAASQGWRLGAFSGVAGGLVARNYASAGGAANVQITPIHAVYAQLLAAHDGERKLTGLRGSAAFTSRVGTDLSFGLSGNLRSRGYRELLATQQLLQPENLNPTQRNQIAVNMAWDLGTLGSLSGGMTREGLAVGDPAYGYNLSWNTHWRNIYFTLGFARSLARDIPLNPADPASLNGRITGNNYFFANLNIPLGWGVTTNSYVRQQRDVTRTGAMVGQRLNERLSYNASVEKVHGPSQNTSTQFSASLLAHYASLSAGMGQGDGRTSFHAQASGGVIATSHGVAFSPYPVQDTYGIVKTGDVAGLRINAPGGPVWSGPGGLAALPSLQPYRESRVEVSANDLPLDVDVDDGAQAVRASRGAVLNMSMRAARVIRWMLTVSTADGALLPAGTSVLRGEEFHTAAAARGRVLVQSRANERIYAELANGQRCEIQGIQLHAQAGDDLFQAGTAVCR